MRLLRRTCCCRGGRPAGTSRAQAEPLQVQAPQQCRCECRRLRNATASAGAADANAGAASAVAAATSACADSRGDARCMSCQGRLQAFSGWCSPAGRLAFAMPTCRVWVEGWGMWRTASGIVPLPRCVAWAGVNVDHAADGMQGV
eukprot:53270-Chlamydomonas_euryale.AAC.1